MDTTLSNGKQIKDLKVVELKKELSARNQPTHGKKAELAERLAQSILEENEPMDAEEDVTDNQENLAVTPQKNVDLFDDPQIRKSSRSERYTKSSPEIESNNSFLSEDDDDAVIQNVRRSSSIRRSIFQSLGLQNDPLIVSSSTPPDTSKKLSCVAMRTRSHSRERTVDISPERSRIFEALSTPKTSGSSAKRRDKTSARLAATLPRGRRSGSLESKNSNTATMKRRSSSVGPASARKPPVPFSSTRRPERTNRFAIQHQKLFEKQMTLGEHKDHRLRRHLELTAGVSDQLKRLATPKKPSVARKDRVPDNNAGMVTKANDFKFGTLKPEEYSAIPKKQPTSVQPEYVAKMKMPRQIEAKELSKRNTKTRCLTRPADETHIEYLATPKGKAPLKTPSRPGYRPHIGPLGKFVDTTKLSDRELELAREAGIVRPPSARKRESLIEKNKKKTGDLINLRRKLDL